MSPHVAAASPQRPSSPQSPRPTPRCPHRTPARPGRSLLPAAPAPRSLRPEPRGCRAPRGRRLVPEPHVGRSGVRMSEPGREAERAGGATRPLSAGRDAGTACRRRQELVARGRPALRGTDGIREASPRGRRRLPPAGEGRGPEQQLHAIRAPEGLGGGVGVTRGGVGATRGAVTQPRVPSHRSSKPFNRNRKCT